MKKNWKNILNPLICGFIFLALPALSYADIAQNSWAASDHVRARIVFDETNPAKAALEVKMDKGWHTYWKVAGDSGLPPRFAWKDLQGVENIEVLWPLPRKFDEYGFQTYGYKNEVSFPLTLNLKSSEETPKGTLDLEIMVCEEVCIPQSLEVPFDATNQVSSALIGHAFRKVPAPENTSSLRIENVVLGPQAIVITAFSSNKFERPAIFPVIENDAYAFTAKPKWMKDEDDPKKAIIRIPKPADLNSLQEFLSGKTLSIVLSDSRDSIERSVPF